MTSVPETPQNPRAPQSTCSSCGAPVAGAARFCESCGAPVAGTASLPPVPRVPVEELGDAPISAPTRRPAGALPDPPPDPGRRPCGSCGGEVGPDLYCTECGTKAPSERDHFREQPASWAAGVCDKGVTKSRNEDAMAMLAGPEPGSRAVLIVLDGVSNSVDSDVASLAGARAAREVLRMPLPAGMGTVESREAAVAKVFADTAAAANAAVVAVTDPDSPNPASATLTCAVLEAGRISHANIGDSRCYWLPDDGDGVQLTVDDSIAQAQIDSGVAKEVAETGQYAHAITKWLGRDAEDLRPSVGSREVDGSGWLLACSDGLWNYASQPADLQQQVRAAGTGDPTELALALVAFANASGGHDNITVALARVGEPVSSGPPTDDHAVTAPAGPAGDVVAAGERAPGVTGPPDAVPTENPTPEQAGEGSPTDG